MDGVRCIQRYQWAILSITSIKIFVRTNQNVIDIKKKDPEGLFLLYFANYDNADDINLGFRLVLTQRDLSVDSSD